MAYPVYEDNGGMFAEGGTSVTVDYPETVNEDDICIALLGDADNDTFTVPSGWNLIVEYGSNSNWSCCYMWRRCDGTEDGTSQTFSSQLTAGQGVYGIIARFSGCVSLGTPYEDGKFTEPTVGGYYNISSVVTTGEDRLVLSIPLVEDNVSIDTPTTESFAEAFYLTSTYGGDAAMKISYYQASNSETTTSGSAAIGGNDYNGSCDLALLPYVPKRRMFFIG